jgi:zinc transporter ZupT
LKRETVGEPDAGNLHVRFDEGEGSTECMACWLFATPLERAETMEVSGLSMNAPSLLYRDPSVGVAIAIAIALHNIPEGISVSVPIFYATGNRKKAFTYSFLSGLAEPVGAGIAYLALRVMVGGESGGIPSQVMGILFGVVAGIMVYISLDQLLPTSRAYGKGHESVFGLIGGMVIMALSLLLMK